MQGLRGLVQFGLTAVCVTAVIAGLYFALGVTGERVLIDRPGTPARLGTAETSATAFFVLDGDAVEVTMLFSEPGDPSNVFRSRVRLMDGQSHSVVIGEPDEPGGPHRYTFRRIGYTVEMELAPVKTLNASLLQ